MKNYLINQFDIIFNNKNGQTYFSPARVNLIGEHIDYNGGYVFPCALSFGTYGIISKRDDQLCRVYSDGYSKTIYEFDLNHYDKDQNHSWVNYIKGVLFALKENNFIVKNGFDLFIKGTMPAGAGLSSSASLESLVLTMLNDINSFNISPVMLAKLGKFAENQYVGVNSGIMDQFAVLLGKKDHAIMLNTQTLSYEQIPLILGDYRLVIVNSNKQRGLSDSKYNERYSQCQSALNTLSPIYLIPDLCSLESKELDSVRNLLDPLIFKRVVHVVTEQQRTIQSAKALKENDIITFSRLMNESHMSLKNDYDVTGIELDTLQELLVSHGAIGARMTGAGFGGSVVAIAHKDDVDSIKEKVEDAYFRIIGYKPSFYALETSDGTHILK